MSTDNVVETDVLVIGGGIAGCFAAIKAKERGVDVTLVDKGYVGKTGETPFAKHFGVFNPEWGHDLEGWMNQVRFIGEYINNPEWTEITLKESYARWKDMLSWGVEFYKYDDGEFVSWPPRPSELMAKFPMQSIRMRQRKHAEVYRAQALKTGVRIMDRIVVVELLRQDGHIVGAVGHPTDKYDCYVFKAKAVVMAAGAAAFKPNGTPLHVVTGDGEAMAYRAGAEITGKEWNDCHPSRAEFPAWQWSPRKDLSTSSRDDYGGLPPKVNAEGERFADGSSITLYIEDVFEADAGRAPVFWEFGSGSSDYHGLVAGPKGVPRQQVDLEAERFGRVRMVVGSSLGMSVHNTEGIWPVDMNCATQLAGLYAAGDSLGARPAGSRYPNMGFSTAFCSTTGTRAGLAAAAYASSAKNVKLDREKLSRIKKTIYAPTERKGGFTPRWVTQVLQNTMMPYWVLYVKHEARLLSALTQIEFIRDRIVPKLTAKDPHELRLAHETRNMVLCAEMKLRASLFRTESRGTHYREDYPRRNDPEWLAWVKIRDEQGEMKLTKEPIPRKWWPDLSLPYEERYPLRFPRE
ncbi:MAG: FAD-binding protein [Deltaproteobacteria bacterium]|nr:FAD-binding protein [Deltaproteobacteria bacterium]MBW2138364.1 FAD-binding protein [Deltaproteobacteria bacterium]